MIPRIDRIESRGLWLAVNMAVWLGVVVLYSHSIEIWHALVAAFGKAVAGGTPIALAVLLVALATVWGRRLLGGLSWPWAAASAVIFVVGLLATDPDFPAKRIHIPEYFALTLLVYWSCRHHLPRQLAVWGAVILAAGLGGIDEILQGAMAARTFGLRDIGINAMGAVSAGLYLQSLSKKVPLQPFDSKTFSYAVILLFGLSLLLLGAGAHKGTAMPLWVYLPALSVLPLAAVDRAAPGARLLDALSACCATALLFLGGIDALDIDFR
ncbi:MAG: VanZ family protein [Rhodospirillaceae bacterium]|nr:VanZ family protein [Rhodospirillaceae bacterium]MDD9916402.1 VanZ family protein [Rhodospirillaceae bacterium]MDD9924379.1 VanZ family protein [Rhodospirillaceae bacterium]